MERIIQDYFLESMSALGKLDHASIAVLVERIRAAGEFGNTIYVFGNGGSASTASHFTADLLKTASTERISKYKAMCLSDNIAALTAYSNDIGFDEVFVGQMSNFATPEDIIIAISCSGNSKNVLKAIAYGNQIGAYTVGLCGMDGGALKKMVDLPIHVSHKNMQRVEDIHLSVLHSVICALVAK